jgi:hypothetical protein
VVVREKCLRGGFGSRKERERERGRGRGKEREGEREKVVSREHGLESDFSGASVCRYPALWAVCGPVQAIADRRYLCIISTRSDAALWQIASEEYELRIHFRYLWKLLVCPLLCAG